MATLNQFDMKRFVVGTIGFVVITVIEAAGWHLILFKDVYSQFGEGKPPAIHLGLMATLLQAMVFTYLYPLFYRGGSPFFEGLKFGVLMGIFLGSYGVLGVAAKFQVEPLLTWILYEGLHFLIQFSLLGIAIGLLYGRLNHREFSHGLR